MAHVKAIEGMDAKGVMTQSDFSAILAGIGKTIASVPESMVMGVYNSMRALVGDTGVPKYVLSKQKPTDALAAYSAFMEFKDTVKVSQPEYKTSGSSLAFFFVLAFLGFAAAVAKGLPVDLYQ